MGQTKKNLHLWLMAARPATLPAAIAPVWLGGAMAWADGHFYLPGVVAAGLMALLLQIGVNLANDYFDYQSGVDTPARLGPVRVTQGGLIAPRTVKKAMAMVLAMAALVGLYLSWLGGWLVFFVGIAALVSALAYSGGPYPLASHALGDLFVFVFFGPVAVCGTYYVQANQLSHFVLLAAISLGLLICAILVVNNLRDIPTDRAAGKMTLAVMLGAGKTVVYYGLLLVLAYLPPLVLCGVKFGSPVLLPFLSAPLAIYWYGFIKRHSGAELNRALAGTAGLALVFALLFGVGFLLAS